MSKLVKKVKELRVCSNLAHSISQTCQPSFWFQRWFLWMIYPLLGPNWSQNQKCPEWLKFGTFDISNILISILMSKITFIKYLSLVWPKLVAKLKVLRINFFDLKNGFYEIFTCYQGKLTPRLKLLWNLRLIFQVFQSWIQNLIKVSLSNYYMLCQNWSLSWNFNLECKI